MKSKNFNDQSSRIILKIIGSENARKILKSTSKCPMSASQISTECNIPLTKTYRWIKKLQNMKFLQSSGMVSEDGRKIKLYKSLVKTIIFNPNDVDDSNIHILGIGNIHICNRCGSRNCTLDYDSQNDLWNYKCLGCSIKYVQTNFVKLKEEQQKVILLEELNTQHLLREEQQKVLLLESLVQEN